MSRKFDIYRHERLAPCLNAAFARRTGLSKVASAMGYRSPRSVAMVLNGQRLPSQAMAARIASYLALDDRSRAYLNTLVSVERARTASEKATWTRELARLRLAVDHQTTLEQDEFRTISPWYVLPLKQLVESPGFRADPDYLCKRLRRKATADQIRHALADMEAEGLLSRNEAGALQVAKSAVIAQPEQRDDAIRAHHRQMLHRALDAIGEQDLDAREFRGMTFAVSPRRIPEVKKRLRDFIVSMAKDFHSDAASEVAQLNLQFFFHTEPVESPSCEADPSS